MRIIQPPFLKTPGHPEIDVDPAAFTVTAADVVLQVGGVLQAVSAEFTVTGADASLREEPSYVVTVSDVSLDVGNRINASRAEFNVTGSAVTFGRIYYLNIDPAAFTVTGSEVTLAAEQDFWLWGDGDPIFWGDDDGMEL